jgi:hypothetical protein
VIRLKENPAGVRGFRRLRTAGWRSGAAQNVENPTTAAEFSTICSVDEQNVENRQPGFGFSTNRGGSRRTRAGGRATTL